MTAPSAVRACTVGDIDEDEALVLRREDTGWEDNIALFFTAGGYHALNDTCTHEDASLADGWIEDGEVECPIHSAKFSLCSGAPLCLPAMIPARTHQVEIRGDDVWVLVGTPAAED